MEWTGFTLTINTENDAFKTNPEIEMTVLLQDVIDRINDGHVQDLCVDSNGNVVGRWKFTSN